MKYGMFSADGRCRMIATGALGVSLEAGDILEELPDDAEPEDYWLARGVPASRTVWTGETPGRVPVGQEIAIAVQDTPGWWAEAHAPDGGMTKLMPLGGAIAWTPTITGVHHIRLAGALRRDFVVDVLDLEALKLRVWGDVKRIRDAKIESGVFVSGYGVFDSDSQSRENINGAVTGAMLAASAGVPFAIVWKLADNSLVSLNGAEMIAVGQAVLAWVAGCHARSQVVGTEIQAASSVAALTAIDIESGWPS